ncbi:MAG TPA: bifunctional folylpolyglutamate synthase/dihydrofolate synthase, partial [Elusimicrobia bacterium]|nr:bifunctional folylpolyglutamate synthase/dihydrofolate synthase [Elusimicrobiota bacterium]
MIRTKSFRSSEHYSKISNGVDYQEIVQQLEKRERFGFLFGLERIDKFLKELNHPERNLQIIHITGTNGKGSTASFIAKILEFAGYRVGLYTSPHLVDIRERIQINSIPISKKDFVRLYSELSTINYKLVKELTYFEFLTALAFQYFFEKKVDFLILEVGLGGRLDATNVIERPLVELITNIDYEHTEYLGKTLKKITYEKAGIIKNNSFTVTGVKQKNVLSLLKRICAERKNRLFTLGENFRFLSFSTPNY